MKRKGVKEEEQRSLCILIKDEGSINTVWVFLSVCLCMVVAYIIMCVNLNVHVCVCACSSSQDVEGITDTKLETIPLHRKNASPLRLTAAGRPTELTRHRLLTPATCQRLLRF